MLELPHGITLAAFAGALGEIMPGGHRARYTWGGKGWGGAGPDGRGFDCSGFACGLLTRLGLMSHRSWTNTDGLWANYPEIPGPGVIPLDLALYGKNDDPSHVAVVLLPGQYVIEAGGGGRQTQPGGSDWPPRRGRAPMVQRWGYRSDLLGVVRVLPEQTESDHRLLSQWQRHVLGASVGRRIPLSQPLKDWGYRPVWSRYAG